MLSNLRYWLSDYRVLAALALVATAAVAYFGMDKLGRIGVWLVLLLATLGVVWLVVWIVRRARARRAANAIEAVVNAQGEQAVTNATPAARADAEQLRERMGEAVKAIKSSKLGQLKGNAALYELPWYVIIGNPAAGKSTAILNSGLRFPFEDNRSNVIRGLGGTRNCDWYFTTEGIVLDTAGRYSVSAEDRLEWLTFLDLLKQHRSRAPINGILIAASIGELSGSKPEFAIELAKNLRQRVQELTERLEVFAPVYVVFTKADLIAGFNDFFRGLDPSERENAWGATLPYAMERPGEPRVDTDALASFDHHFDLLAEGLREMGVAQMAMLRGRDVPPGLLTLPMEFAGIKPALRTFIATLFEENPYQFKPVFRGFYFTSALQEGVTVQPASDRVARQFALSAANGQGERLPVLESSHFLLGLFRKVIFADRDLVKQYASPKRSRLRYAAFAAGAAVLALALAGWAWSYTGNRQLVANVTADFDKAVAMQRERVDLQSRIEALLILHDRMAQLDQYRQDNPVALGLGLYQGDRIEAKLRSEFFHGMRQLMLQPVTARLEGYLGEVIANRGQVRMVAAGMGPVGVGAGAAAAATAATGAVAGMSPPSVDSAMAASNPAAMATGDDPLYREPSATDAEDAYNALKTYLMLGDRSRVEASHLDDQLTRFWRNWLEANRGSMPREDLLRAAGRLMSTYVALAADPQWPLIEPKFGLVDDGRETLRLVMKGTPARDRVYAQIKARAATRFAPVTVASLLGEDGARGAVQGSHSVPGTFTCAAWDDYVKDAIGEASNAELSSTDWVLEATVQDDLTLAGSPEHVAKELTALYKADYAREWARFLQGVSVAEFGSFEQAAAQMDRIGDPRSSPLRKLLEAVNRETVWDNPSAQRGDEGGGIVAWFNRVVLGRTPQGSGTDGKPAAVAMGPIGREFQGLARLMHPRDGQPPLADAYFEALGKLRSRLNAIKGQGDPGPGARKLMQETLDGNSGEIGEAQRLVDEQMLNGLSDSQRQALRPLLIRPVVQAFAALVRPAEGELNRTWAAQVYQPFEQGIGRKYPYDAAASVEAAAADEAQIFGPDGAIARFSNEALGSLVIRRGNTMTAQRWADIGINLRPELMDGYAGWVVPVGGAGAGTAGTGGPSMVFEIRPGPALGREYTITVDGQQLRYRNTPATWSTFTLPNPQGTPGVRIEAVTADGRNVEVFNAPGTKGMSRLFETARTTPVADQHYRMAIGEGDATVSMELRIVSVSQAQERQTTGGKRGGRLPAVVAGMVAPTASVTAASGTGAPGSAAANTTAPAPATPGATPAGTAGASRGGPAASPAGAR
ncbi:type VI secretion system membrane subunit TssM [Aerolutibacter ruishenii]|uniref:Type VI secretion system protein ImpL n=1 Tax=Aerolutibacter ruishenii TaxID=686800 RepID=A0A562M185_9GAMM|nr:type VI secretion system membrane subunit TssM [Lysobacter ruishenii]TWI13572.1 type VI secretion system protein ImpL [Lysobacter ruishenii]